MCPRLFRKRFLPNEITELKDDKILSYENNILITQWDVLKPRKDISRGISAYFIDLGIKVSKVYNHEEELVYWYCDIIDSAIDSDNAIYTFTDLLIDVLIYPDKHVEVVDMDEFADMIEQNVLNKDFSVKALRSANHLLQLIYSGKFSTLTSYIEKAERATIR